MPLVSTLVVAIRLSGGAEIKFIVAPFSFSSIIVTTLAHFGTVACPGPATTRNPVSGLPKFEALTGVQSGILDEDEDVQLLTNSRHTMVHWLSF